jgi:hypothetical protein
MELENSILSEVVQAPKVKGICFLSYLEYGVNTNTATL